MLLHIHLEKVTTFFGWGCSPHRGAKGLLATSGRLWLLLLATSRVLLLQYLLLLFLRSLLQTLLHILNVSGQLANEPSQLLDLAAHVALVQLLRE